MKTALLVALSLIAGLLTTQAETAFNSTNEFSTTQGQDGWYYGYYDGDVADPYTPYDFEYFPKTNGNSWIVHRGDPSGYWTSLYATGGHPNGPQANYYQGTEHWTVRRWVSDVTGTILIEGFLRKSNGTYGDGIDAYIFLNDSIVFYETRPGNDPAGMEYSLEIGVLEGDIIDFAIAPRAYDMYDSTVFTAIGTLMEEMENPVIALAESVNDKGCIEASSSFGTVVTASIENPASEMDVDYIWSTLEGEIGQGPEFMFNVGLNSNTLLYVTAHNALSGDSKSTFKIIRVCDSTAPVITIEQRTSSSFNALKPIDLDISVFDRVDGDIKDFTVCIGKTSVKTLDSFTGGASVKVENPLTDTHRKVTDVTVIASDASGNTTIKTVQVNHKKQSGQKKPSKPTIRKEKDSHRLWWRKR